MKKYSFMNNEINISGFYYKDVTIVNDNSSIVNK